jgi:crotonobetainyl-CoA:carnitine CoA-transferase CaiB-like acyl-CoA transferase
MVTPPAAKPLAGIRVLDLTRFVSGAYCTMVLDALGADVIKVEGLPGGDPYRAQGAVQVGSLSGLFASLNTGKRSIAVDLRAADGTGLVRRLAQASDVFVENARPGSLERAGLGPDRLHALNPRLVYASISGFGQAGPDAARGGFDLILQAASGIMAVTGNEAGGPVKVGAPVLDIGAGMSAATAIMAALLARTADGLGRTVSSSLLEFALSCFTSYAADILETGTSPGLLGNDSPQFAPYGVFRCRDGSLALAGAGSEPLWLKLCDVLGQPDWAADPRFATNADRLRHRAELTAEIERVLTGETAAHWQQALDGAGIPASPVLPPAAALTSAQAEALQIRHAARTPDGYGYQTVRPPLSVASHPDEPAGPAGPSPAGADPSAEGPSAAGTDPAKSSPSAEGPSTAGTGPANSGPSAHGTLGYSRGAPALGQHTTEILREAGLDPADITDLAARGIVAG